MNKAEDHPLPDECDLDRAAPPSTPVPWPPEDPEIARAVADSMANGDWGRYQSEVKERLTAKLQTLTGRDYAKLVSSGSIGIELALRAAVTQPGQFVLLAAYDYPGNFRAIEAVGCRPLLVDTQRQSWSPSEDAILDALERYRPAAALLSHLHGDLFPADRIAAACQSTDTVLIEDACQVPGAQIAGRPAGGWGDISIFSFGGSKLLTAGHGGAVLTSDRRLFQRLTLLNERPSEMAPLSPLQAAALLPQVDRLAERTKQRQEAVQGLLAALQGSQLLHPSINAERQAPHSAFYKLGLLIAHDAIRDPLLEMARQQEIRLGAGFASFALRSERRCISAGPLQNALELADRTVLLDHTSIGYSPQHGARLGAHLRDLEECLKTRRTG